MADFQPKDLVTTREAAAMLGVGTTSIKRWADGGQLPCVRTAGGHRRFSRAAVLAFRRLGIDDAEVGEPAAEPAWVGEWVARLTDGHRRDDDIETALLRERERLASWAAVADAMGAVLEELGRRWVAGELSVIEEHLASARLARAAMLVVKEPPGENPPRALLVGAQGDDHSLGLSLCEMVLRAHGWMSLWGGTRAPTNDLCAFIASVRPQMVVMSASSYSTDGPTLSAQAERIAEACRQVEAHFVIGGRGHWPLALSHGHRLHRFSELSALLAQRA